MTDENTNCLQGVACPRCGQSYAFSVQAETWATVLDSGVEDHSGMGYGDDSITQCGDCNFSGPWKIFRAGGLPYSVCVDCHTVVYLIDGQWQHALPMTPVGQVCERTGQHHQPKWLTLGELRQRTAHLPDTLPVTIWFAGEWEDHRPTDWANLRPDHIPEQYDPERDEPSLVLGAHDDFDTRQW